MPVREQTYDVALNNLWRRITGSDTATVNNVSDDGTFYDVTITVPKGHVAGVLLAIAQVSAEDAAMLAAGIPEHMLALHREAVRSGV